RSRSERRRDPEPADSTEPVRVVLEAVRVCRTRDPRCLGGPADDPGALRRRRAPLLPGRRRGVARRRAPLGCRRPCRGGGAGERSPRSLRELPLADAGGPLRRVARGREREGPAGRTTRESRLMCGICGIVARSESAEIGPRCLQLTRSLAHRGPDGEGFWQATAGRQGLCTAEELTQPASLVLGHRRLSIVDVDGGAQPMTNEDGSVWVTYNGEIYN